MKNSLHCWNTRLSKTWPTLITTFQGPMWLVKTLLTCCISKGNAVMLQYKMVCKFELVIHQTIYWITTYCQPHGLHQQLCSWHAWAQQPRIWPFSAADDDWDCHELLFMYCQSHAYNVNRHSETLLTSLNSRLESRSLLLTRLMQTPTMAWSTIPHCPHLDLLDSRWPQACKALPLEAIVSCARSSILSIILRHRLLLTLVGLIKCPLLKPMMRMKGLNRIARCWP